MANTESIRKGKQSTEKPVQTPDLDTQIKQLEKEKLELEKQQAAVALEKEKIELEKLKREEAALKADQSGTYIFDYKVTRESVRNCERWVERFARANPGKGFTIMIASGGGYVISGLRLYDTLMNLRGQGHEITIIVKGYAASMAGILLQAGTKRLIAVNARMMIHEMASGDYGKTTERREALKSDIQLEDLLLDILASRSKLKKAEIKRRWKKKDWWLSAQEAVDLGFADEIYGDPAKAVAKGK